MKKRLNYLVFQKNFVLLQWNKKQYYMYKETDDNVLTVQDTEMMDLETARQLLHQMVKEVYSRP